MPLLQQSSFLNPLQGKRMGSRRLRFTAFLPVIALAMAGTLSAPAHGLPGLFSCSRPGRTAVALCLEGLLHYHCGLLSGGNAGRLSSCASTVHSAVKHLQPENLSIPSDTSPGLQLHVTAFTDSLAPLFSQNSTEILLSRLNNRIRASSRFDEPHSLWSTPAPIAPDRTRRLSILGVMFQSVTPVNGQNLHFHLLKLSRLASAWSRSSSHRARARQINRNIALYQEFADTLLKTKIKGPWNPAFSLYPPIRGAGDFDPTLHHFYVPAHLSRRLLDTGHRAAPAAFVALLFNALYELRKIDQKLGLNRWPYSYPGAFSEPARLKRVEMNVRKIYTGYVGALFGAGKEARAVSYPVFRRAFAADPRGTLQLLMKAPL